MSSYHPKQVQRFIDETPKTIAGLIALSCIVVYTYIDYVPLYLVLLWSILQFGFVILRFLNAKNLQKYLNKNDDKNLNKHINYLVFMIILSAIFWNLALIGGSIYASNHYEMLSVILSVGLITAAALSLSAIFKVYVVYYFTLLIPMIIYISRFDEPIHNSILLLYFVYIIYTFSIAKSVDNSLWDAIKYNIKLEKNEILLFKKSKDLEIAKNKAEQSEKIKSEFLANMSHEIRTPINGVIGMTYLALKEDLNFRQKDYLQKINSSAKGLLGIINDILDFSKIEAGKLEIVKVDFKLDSVMENLKNIIEFKTQEKGLELNISYENDKIFYGDSLRISQILINLTNNALKFTSKGQIDIDVKYLENSRVRFCVSDTGIGLSREQQSKLFKSFSQADASTTKKYGGTGLGLAISKQLVELMDGEIWCESELGEGSRFIFEIILAKGTINNIQENKEVDINQIQTLSGSKILLVEDNLINQEIIIGLLENSGIIIDIANNGKEGVELFNQNNYELILMDIQMPIMDGYEATRIIRAKDSEIPIIALTANAMKEDVEKTQKVGMNEHLNKPIDIEKLFVTLLKYLCNGHNQPFYLSKKVTSISRTNSETEVTHPESESRMYDFSRTNSETQQSNIEIPNFKNIDTELGLKHLAGNKKLYLKILRDFYINYKDLSPVGLIPCGNLENLNEEDFKRTIHTLKGLSANIGATSLSKISKELEETLSKDLFDKFYKELNKVLDELKDCNIDKLQDTQTPNLLELDTTKRDELFKYLSRKNTNFSDK